MRRPRTGGSATPAAGPAVLAAALLACCGAPFPEEGPASAPSSPAASTRPAGPSLAGPSLAGPAAVVGEAPVPHVHLADDHSDALVRWKLHGVRDRVVVHVDGHIDMDWMPEESIARIRSAAGEEPLRSLEFHPDDLTARANTGFGVWNFIYAAARTGIVREEVWVVPDGALASESAWQELRAGYAETLSGVSLEELRDLRFDGGVVTGSLIGVPIRILELRSLPRLDEPVLLDIDVDYFTTDSPVRQRVLPAPWITVEELLSGLAAAGLKTDLATISQSTMGGYAPYEVRWIGRALEEALARPGEFRSPASADRRGRLHRAMLAASGGRPAEAVELLAPIRGGGADASVESLAARALRDAGSEQEARRAADRARQLDPLAARLDLFHADSARLAGRFAEALEQLRRFVRDLPADPAAPYAKRRIGSCLMALGRPVEAAQAFRETLAERPDHADTHFSLSEALGASGDLPGAIAAQRVALGLRPFDPNFSWRLGSLLLKAGDAAGAEPHLVRTVEGIPSSTGARMSLALCLEALGRFDQAEAHAGVAWELSGGARGPEALLARIRARRAAPPS